jgi:3-deoxy-D-manno-octulosonic-acid transferase
MLLPFDLRSLMAQTLAELHPAGLVIVETEIWPGLLHAASDAGIGAVVVSGRISERAARRYSLIRPLLRDTLRCVTAFGMQTQADAERVIALGAPVERVRVTGSLKYARLLPRLKKPHALPGVDGRPLLIAASTQPGEEEIVVEACSAIWASYPDCLLVLAPRRPERFDEAGELLRRRGLRHQRRSSLGVGVDRQTQVVLLDSVGELPALLGAARAVFVGGTIAPLGGHNVLEPAAAGSAVCFGPHTENVAEAAASLIAAGGAALVRDAAELRSLWQQLLADPDAAYAMGARARQVVEAREQVLADTVALVERALS